MSPARSTADASPTTSSSRAWPSAPSGTTTPSGAVRRHVGGVTGSSRCGSGARQPAEPRQPWRNSPAEPVATHSITGEGDVVDVVQVGGARVAVARVGHGRAFAAEVLDRQRLVGAVRVVRVAALQVAGQALVQVGLG